jgi:hypothetical protein
MDDADLDIDPRLLLGGLIETGDRDVDRTFEVADHVLVVGDVRGATSAGPDELESPGPLLNFNRGFHVLGELLARPAELAGRAGGGEEHRS